MMNCMIAGVGGQGTVLASKLIAAAAMQYDYNVRTTETIGMAQRGGSVVSHVRISDKTIHSPLIPRGEADLIIAFEPAEGVRLLPYLHEDGLMIVCDLAVRPVTDSLGDSGYEGKTMIDFLEASEYDIAVMDGAKLIESCGPKALNVALLGAAIGSGRFPFRMNDIEAVIKEKIPERFHEMNLRALGAGSEMYNER